MKIRLIIGTLLIIGGIVFFAKALVVHRDVTASDKWPYVEGVIIESKLSFSLFSGDGEAHYNPDVKYTYTVNGRQYTSDVIMFGGVIDGPHSKMYKYIERYPKGNIVKVYYNPTKPEEAVLEPIENDVLFYFWMALLLATCGILLIINYFMGFFEGFIAFFEGPDNCEAN